MDPTERAAMSLHEAASIRRHATAGLLDLRDPTIAAIVFEAEHKLESDGGARVRLRQQRIAAALFLGSGAFLLVGLILFV